MSCQEYHIPGHIQEHVDYITPGVRLRVKTQKRSRDDLEKRGNTNNYRIRPQITQLPSKPEVNSTTCDIYVVADCTRSMCFQRQTEDGES